MTRLGARRMVRTLVRRDVARRLGNRLVAWISTAFAAWSLALLIAVILAESRFGPSEYAFHAGIIAVLGLLPAFLAAPVRISSGIEAVRRADRGAAVEAWLDYQGGPAERLLESRACEALSIATIAGFGRPQPTKTARVVVASLFAFGFLSFAIAQIVSVYSGYGVSLTYPDKEIPDFVAQRDLEAAQEESWLVVPGLDQEQSSQNQVDAPGAREYGISAPRGNELLVEPDFVAHSEPGGETMISDASTEKSGIKPGQAPDRATAGRNPRTGTAGTNAAEDHTRNTAGPETNASGEARTPGWEGTGRAMDSSPLVDYRARFEQQLTESTGKETRLGNTPSAELVSAAITEFYTSFDTHIAIGSTIDSGLARVMEAWREAFGTGTGVDE